MPQRGAAPALERWTLALEGEGAGSGASLRSRTNACMAALQALDLARADLDVGCGDAERTIRRIAGYLQRFARRTNLLAFEAWGIQLESAPREVLAEQAAAAVTGLKRVLSLPLRPLVSSPLNVVLLEPDAAEARKLRTALVAPHRRLVVARTVEEGWTVCRTDVVDVLVVDLDGVGEEGRDLLLGLRERLDRTSVLALTSGEDASEQAEAFALGASACFTKPVNPQVVATAVSGHLDRMARTAEVGLRDVLTGLTNRAGFEEAHARARAAAVRYDEPLALAMVDLDRFKAVNDRWGHPTGDRVLLGVATLLEEGLREGDLVARWGGEEFAVLFPRTDVRGAGAALENVLRSLAEQRFRASGGEELGPLTFSAGVADATRSLDATVADADRRLYRAKAGGRARVVVEG